MHRPSIRDDRVGGLVNQDLAGLGGDLQPLGQVDRIPDGRVVEYLNFTSSFLSQTRFLYKLEHSVTLELSHRHLHLLQVQV